MQNATRPDVDRLIIGEQTRKRRRDVTRLGVAALAVVLIGGGVYAVTQIDRSDAGSTGIANQPSATSAPSVPATAPPTLSGEPGGETVEPGTYRLPAGFDRSGAEIEADLTFESRDWRDGKFPIVEVGGFYGGLGVYQPNALAAGSGCTGDQPTTDLGRGSEDLARKLAQLPGSTVVQPVTRVQAFGREAQHLRLRIDDQCPLGQSYRVAESIARGGRGISYSPVPTTVVMDFWIIDIGAAWVVVDAWHQSGASADVVDQVARTRDSITFVDRPAFD